jgi:hypothetical protein
MPADDDVESGCGRVRVEFLNIVEHIDMGGTRFNDDGEGQRGSPESVVHVASDGYDRRESFERVENFGLPGVPGVNNQVRPFQRSPGFVAQQAVSV